MSQVVYNINGVPAEYEFAGSSVDILEKVTLNVQGDSSQDILRTTILEFGTSTRQSNRVLTTATQPNIVELDPISDGLSALTRQQQLEITPTTVRYEFIRPIVLPATFFIAEISTDRTEVKLGTFTPLATTQAYDTLARLTQGTTYVTDIRLVADNVLLEQIININLFEGNIVLKLEQPLGNNITVNSNISFEEQIAQPVEYVLTSTVIQDEIETLFIKGPNFSIELEDQSNLTTEYFDYTELFSYPVTGSVNKLYSELNGTGVGINVDYSRFENFVHFSSAKERLANFKYKVDLIQQYELEKQTAATITNATAAVNGSNQYYDTLIKGIISKFDGYERYLYYESSSLTWPKSTSIRPYINITGSSATVTTWYSEYYASASLYDELNESGLEYTIPEFIRQNDANAPYSLFTNMVGQHFDELWLYAKDITNKYNGDNRLNYGLSKDLIAKSLQGFGVKLYSSNFSVANLSSLLLGEWYDSGSEHINTFVTASNEPTPDKEVLLETYKRIYHNLPYLIKTKGTERGLRALITCFGIPSNFLRIREFGGVDRDGYPEYLLTELQEFLTTQTLQELVARQTGPHLGPDYEPVDKIRVANTGSVVAGDTLSNYVSIIKESEKYTQDNHLLEVGFSPTYAVNEYIQNNITASYNIDNYIGDPRHARNRKYYDLLPVASDVLGSLERYDVYDFVRLIKFYDNQLFKMIKDFVPARAVTDSGIIIKPHLLERSKYPVPVFEGTTPEYSASLSVGLVSSSDGGVIGNLSTAYSQSISSPLGIVYNYISTEEAKFNGELQGTLITVTTGELNDENPFKEIVHPSISYNTVYNYIGVEEPNYFYGYPVAAGEASILWNEGKGGNYFATHIKIRLAPATGSINLEDSFREGINTIIVGGTPYYVNSITILGSIGLIALQPTATALGFAPNPALLPITQSNSNVEVVIDPYIPAKFSNSEYNALLNNATNSANSARVQKVDYSSGTLTPHNLDALRSGSAQPAELQEYVYNSNGFISSRYVGKQMRGTEFNMYFPGDVSYGKTPVAENKSTYFTYFNEVTDASPVVKEHLDVDIRYLVDDQGTYLDVLPDSEEFLLLQQTFRNGGKSKISLDNTKYLGFNMTPVNGEHKVFKTGRKAEPIVYSHSSSFGGNSTGSIQFGDDPNVNDYRGRYVRNNSQSPTYVKDDTGYVILYDNPVSQGADGSYNISTGEYTIGATSGFDIFFNVTVLFDSLDNKGLFDTSEDLEVIVEYNAGSGWQQLQHNLVDLQGTTELKTPNVIGGATLIGAGVGAISGVGITAGATALGAFGFLGTATALFGAATIGAPVLLVLGAAGLIAGAAIGSGTGALINPRLVGDPYTFKVTTASSDNLLQLVALPYYRVSGLPAPLQAGDKVRVRFFSKEGDFEIKANSKLEILQAITPVVAWDRSYWVAGSNPWIALGAGGFLENGNKYLFARSSNISEIYGSKQYSTGSADNEYPVVQLPFIVKPGDQIRFLNDERYTYNIVKVKEPGQVETYPLQGGGTFTNSGSLVLELDTPLRPFLTGSFNLLGGDWDNPIDSFLLRTFVNDPKNIIVSGIKPSGSTSGGILQPEFLTDTTQETLKRILPNLRRDVIG